MIDFRFQNVRNFVDLSLLKVTIFYCLAHKDTRFNYDEMLIYAKVIDKYCFNNAHAAWWQRSF